MGNAKGFVNKDAKIKSEVRYYCPYCGIDRSSEDEIKEHYAKEMEWQDRWRESRPDYVKFVNPDGEAYRILVIRRISNGYNGKCCGSLLTLHVASKKDKDHSYSYENDESYITAREHFDLAYPSTEDEYNDYRALSKEERETLWKTEYSRQQNESWIAMNQRIKNGNSSLSEGAWDDMFESMSSKSYDNPWDEFDHIGYHLNKKGERYIN